MFGFLNIYPLLTKSILKKKKKKKKVKYKQKMNKNNQNLSFRSDTVIL